ncbi:hypothetical protein [Luteolibacter soli]|uniref:Uncharacterized protein n=1 Tax=Luteolibacter soli TaxID=3135280 RepID=A0ABU9AS99_9BACT
MKIHIPKFFRLAVLGAAGFGLVQSLVAANLMNGNFATATSNQANYWSTAGTPPGATTGKIRGGTNGGNGWTTSYFGGAYPTDSTFATTLEVGAVRQNLSGAGNTFVAGVTYTVSMDIFGSSTYKTTSNVMWSLAFTGANTVVASDHWFSDEFTAQSVANGGNIPNDHIVTVSSGNTGFRTVTLTYTATAADAGKIIGVQLGGDTQSKYAMVGTAPTPDDYYGMMDNVTFSSNAANLQTFTSDQPAVDGQGFYLNWTIQNPAQISTLTLNSGSGPVDVKPDTDTESGVGMFFVNPTAATTYTLTLNGDLQTQLTIEAGKALSLTRDSNTRVAVAPAYEVTLSWSVQPVGASVSLSNGVSSIDVTADTDPETGLGSKTVVVPNPSTTYTLSANGSPLVATTRVLRENSNTAAFSVSSASVEDGQQITVTWTGAAGGATDWIGIYAIGETPGGSNEYSDAWNYLNGTKTAGVGPANGSMTFTMPVGNYYAVLLLNDGYVMAQGPLIFSVVSPPPVEEPLQVTSITKTENAVTLVWKSKADVTYNVYASDHLQGDPLVDWDEVGTALPSDGDDTTEFTETFGSGTPTRRFYQIEEVPAAP